MHRFGRGFRYVFAYYTGSDPIGDLGSKVKVTASQYPFFLHYSLLTSLLYISTLLFLIKLKFGMPLRYALCRFVVEFHKNQIHDDVMVKFSPYKCSYFKFYWTFKLHFWYKHSTTWNTSNCKRSSDLCKNESHRWRSKVT